MSQFRKITQTETEEFRKAYEADSLSHAMTNALYKTDIRELAYRPKVLADSQFTFSTEIETLPVTNQKKSGRCWIFAALNLQREKAAKTCGLDSFELSQNYMAFWDKFEKVNYFDINLFSKSFLFLHLMGAFLHPLLLCYFIVLVKPCW